MAIVDTKIEQWKSRLLDVSGRNPLLHFRPRKTTTLKITAPDAHKVYEQLIVTGRPLTFYDTKPVDASQIEQPLLLTVEDVDDLAVDSETAASPLRPPLSPDHVQVDADPAKLESLLYRLRLRARTALQEQGVQILFVAIGFLEWREADASSEIIRSPLLLVPVDLERENLFEPYRLVPSDEEWVLNPTLVQKLQADFQLKLEPGTTSGLR